MEERPIDRLLAIMARLRDPQRGCPWDREQTFATIAPYTIEEAFEVADAIERQDATALVEELGDLLLQVVYHAQMAKEQGLFDFDEVARRIADKMVRRHPHVFAEEPVADAAEQHRRWEEMKAAERASRDQSGDASALAGVPRSLPALVRAVKLQQRAAAVGFDWPDADDILAKLEEEIRELREALCEGRSAAVREEMGDLLFTVANLARRLAIDPEAALRAANQKFERRFRALEQDARTAGLRLDALDLSALERLWTAVKEREAAGAAEAPSRAGGGAAGPAQVQR